MTAEKDDSPESKPERPVNNGPIRRDVPPHPTQTVEDSQAFRPADGSRHDKEPR